MNREQAKYLATFLSNLAISIVIVGVLTPILTNQNLDRKIILGIVLSFSSGIILLWTGYYILRKLADE